MRKLRISVTDLATLICRTGDLDSAVTAGPTARDGQKAHQRWQANTKDEAEVRVRSQFEVDDCLITLGGRIDLLDEASRRITEIKSTVVPVEFISESQKALHRAQVRLYAFCLQNDSDLIQDWALDVLYVNIRDESPARESEVLSCDEVLEYGNDILQRYVQWMASVEEQHAASIETAQALEFPFNRFRTGQRALASMVYRGSRDSFSSLCEAPTGVGKTISTLFPAVKSVGEKNIKQIVYLTAKASGMNAVSDALNKMTGTGLSINTVTLRSKQLTCFCSNGGCERDEQGRCPMTIGFYDRLPEARAKLLSVGVITPALMDEVSWEYQLCPFELAIQMLPWMTVVIADYNYVFDPLVRLPWFSEPRKTSLVLIDEAHNLPDRSRSMFSAALDRYMGQALIPLLDAKHRSLIPRIDGVDKALLKHARGLDEGESVTKEAPGGMKTSVSAAIETLLEMMSEGPALPVEANDWFKALCRYAAIDELYGDSHRTITDVSKRRSKKEVRIQLRCLDASKELQRLYKYYRSICYFSATLGPFSFYNTVLGATEDAKWMQLASPFDESQCAHLHIPSIDTRYRQREQSLPRLVELVNDVVSEKPGNYLVFLPSFQYLERLWSVYVEQYPEQRVWKQSKAQSREERQLLIDAMESPEPQLGFVILGGVFGEGVDYVGNRLIGAIVVGVGLPAVNAEQQLMAEHYRENGYDGYDFANRIPGFTRVLQTVGRVIRTESDRGVIALVDSRFQEPFYRSNMPKHIQPKLCRNRDEWRNELVRFWSS